MLLANPGRDQSPSDTPARDESSRTTASPKGSQLLTCTYAGAG